MDPSFVGTVTVQPGVVFTAGVFIQDGGTFVTGNGTLTVLGAFTQNGGSFSAGSGFTTVGGGFFVGGGSFDHGFGTLRFNGSAGQTLFAGSAPLNNVQIASTGGTVSLTGNMTVGGHWQYLSGVVDPGTSTVYFNGPSQQITGDNTFFNLSHTAPNPAQLSLGGNLTVLGHLDLQGLPGQLLTFNSNLVGTQRTLNALGTFSLQYLQVRDNFAAGPGVSATNSVDLINNLGWNFGGAPTPSPSPTPLPPCIGFQTVAHGGGFGPTLNVVLNTPAAGLLLVVQVMLPSGAPLSTATYSGSPLSNLFRDVVTAGGNVIETWYLANPPTGSANVSINNSSGGSGMYLHATLYSGVHLAAPFGGFSFDGALAGMTHTASLNLSFPDSQAVAYVVAASSPPISPLGGLIQRNQVGFNANTLGLYDRRQTAPGPVPIQVSYPYPVNGGIVALELRSVCGAGTPTPTPTVTVTPCDLIVNGPFTLPPGPHNYCNVVVQSGGILTINGIVTLNLSGSLQVDAGGIVRGTGNGWPAPGIQSNGTGLGGGGQGNGAGGAGGGGHGGAGGHGSNYFNGGLAFGAPIMPNQMGSAGGSGNTGMGGAGGAALVVNAAGDAFLEGSLEFNGQMGGPGGTANMSSGGGGAGGSLWISAQTISGSGFIQALGGNGGNSGCGAASCWGGGGGGGGRVALCAVLADNYLGPVNVSGGGPGAGNPVAQPGGSGTLYRCATASDTPTSTVTKTATVSPTPSATPTVSASATPTVTPSKTATTTLSSTPSVTRTATPSVTSSVTTSATPSASPSATPTATPTQSVTLTATPTQSVTSTSTPSASPSASPSTSPSDTATATPSLTTSPSFTVTPTATPAPPLITQLSPSSGLVTGGYTVIITGSNLGVVATVSFGGAAAAVLDGSFNSITVTAPAQVAGPQPVVVTMPGGLASNAMAFTYQVPSPTATPTGTVTPTPTASPSATATLSSTFSPSASASPSPSATHTHTPFVTPTPTLSVTDTPLPTATPESPAVLSHNVWRPGQGQPLHIGIKSPVGGRVTVNVYNVAAERVRRPFEADVPAGVTVDAVWDGRNDKGEPCGAGVYLVGIRGAGIQRTLKVVLLK